ncbi:RNA polymerase factor sigma-32 [Haematobacter massiliensis]|uniref:RNA polymerase sigma 70 n=1 Tax=Haematobacter massiliensis TaxID=195105 RepID=A0A086XZ87_9RHOB|nr:RNA polymerase factor sigma-32 [Haematobacter massiliensis]KFI27337.1 RNA polymerase sigma 70 [Haematobacter massiliensis]OWJ70754.1 RNA polymerase factor sigma-32 [Haematobacter massiliensis]OWJ84816.1 RNA polymerase factor sigma-32 [Haematobacter massiliensis]QBJ23782.1 RNA polymerase factor sigma-32 [Haematobacter massiliensis]
MLEIRESGLMRRAMTAEMLDADTERSLAEAWRDRGDEAALHRLVTAYLRLAISMAMKFRRYGVPMGDLLQESIVGLMKAAEKFDPDRGVRFSTYAVWWIKASIQDHVMRNWSLVRTGSTTVQKSLFFNLHRVRARLEREARQRGEDLAGDELLQAVADELGVSLRDVTEMERRMSGQDQSLNAVQGADEGREWIDALEDDSPRAEEVYESRHDTLRLRTWLTTAMGDLSERERYIVRERRLRPQPRTLDSLGTELGLSKERVRQIETAAFARLRKSLETRNREVHHFFS